MFGALSSLFCLCLSDSTIVLPPVTKNTSLPEKMLVFMPGGAVPPANYQPTAVSIQNGAAETVRLWVVIPKVFNNLCVITCPSSFACAPLYSVVASGLDQAVKMGWTRNTDKSGLFIAGHSLGGVCANYMITGYPGKFGMLMSFGSYVDQTGDHSLTNYPIPALLMAGELDGGLARPGKLSIWWRQFVALGSPITQKPVFVLPGMNHSNFCPGFDVPGDLMAEVSTSQAQATISQIAGAFVSIHSMSTPRSQDVQTLKAALPFTQSIMGAYTKAEDTTFVRDNHTLGSGSYVRPDGTSRMCEQLQLSVSNLPATDRAKITVNNAWYVDSSNLEHCHTNFTAGATKGTIIVNTCSHTDYYTDIDNTGSTECASQLSCKFESTEQIAVALGVSKPSQPTCADLNKEVVALAESLAIPKTLARFKAKGKPWCYEPDYHVPGDIGPLWLAASLSQKETDTCMEVSSPVLLTGLDSAIYPGNFYCKVLAPERVLDWMMSDSLPRK